jgi:prophage tail gpP-like protein
MAWPASEVATVIVNGQAYTRWESVWVQERWAEAFSYARFTAEEGKILPTSWHDLQVKPGDRCTILLGGDVVLTGTVITRQTSVNATQHMVQLTVKSKAFWPYKSSVFNDPANFDGMTFVQVAKKVLEPLHVTPEIYKGSKFDETPLKNESPQIGANVWDYLENLARSHKAIIGVARSGNPLLIGTHQGDTIGRLADGDNILSMQVTVSCEDLFQDYRVNAGNNGSDDNYGSKAASNVGQASGTAPEYSVVEIPMERPPNDPRETQRRAEYEAIWSEGTKITANYTVQGWFAQNGTLWEAGKAVTVSSPMSMIGGVMKIRTATFQQDNSSGTTTTLECVAPWALLDTVGADVGPPPTTTKSPPSIPAAPPPVVSPKVTPTPGTDPLNTPPPQTVPDPILGPA